MPIDKRKRRLLSLIFVIYPFLFIVGIIDFIIGLILPNKYEDDSREDEQQHQISQDAWEQEEFSMPEIFLK